MSPQDQDDIPVLPDLEGEAKLGYPEWGSASMAADTDIAGHREAIAEELETLALASAVITGSLNQLCGWARPKVPAELAHYVPGAPTLLPAVARKERLAATRPEAWTSIVLLVSQLEVAKRHLKDALTPRMSAGNGPNIDQLAHAWRGVCDLLLEVIEDADDWGIVPAASATGLSWDEVHDQLSLARDGSPDWGVIPRRRLPGWLQRRRERVSVEIDATAVHQGFARDIRIVDVSTHGVGLDLADGMVAGERVTLRLEAGRKLEGTVAWTAGVRAGVVLDEVLAPSDPIFNARQTSETEATNRGGQQ